MKNYVELDKEDIKAIIADHYHIPVKEINKRVKINLSIITEGFGMSEHLVPFLYATVSKGE